MTTDTITLPRYVVEALLRESQAVADDHHTPRYVRLDEAIAELTAAIEAAKQEREAEPVFWYRPTSDGCYEGPIHNNSIEPVRKTSGAWKPLYTAPQPQVPEGMVLVPLSTRMPNPDEHSRVIIFTEGYDFNGEQFFDVTAESLNECAYSDPEDQPEVCRFATHWMPLPRRTEGAQLRGERPCAAKGERMSKDK